LGIELTGHRSQPLTRELLERFDLIVAMEVEHLAGIARLAPRVADRTFLLPVFAPEELSEEIADPDGGSPAVFHRIFGEVLAGVDGMARLFAEPSGVLTTRAA
jgi:protein-tyrosine-phosphatase